MFRHILILCVPLLLSVTADKCIDKSQSLDKSLCQAVQISCPKGQVIYQPNITASDQPCSSVTEPCIDTTIDLMVGVNECNWQSSCNISFPTTTLQKCGKDVKSLQINNWYCVDKIVPKHAFDGFICDNFTNFGANIDHGVIRSHADFPWTYRKKRLSPDLNVSIILQCTKTINLRPGPGERFLVSVQSYDIDKENDIFTINGETPHVGYNKIFSAEDKRIQFKFNVNTMSTYGGLGFLLCFKKLKAGDEKDGSSACDSIMTITDTPVENITSPNTYCNVPDVEESCEDILISYHTAMKPLESTSHSESTMKPLGSSSQPVNTVKSLESSIQPVNRSVSTFCSKCLSKPKVGSKCKRKCCKGQTVNPKCSSSVLNRGNLVPGKCKVPKKKVDRLCNKCESQSKCRNKFKKRCKACCSDRKDNLAKCKKFKRKSKQRRKQGRLGKGNKNKQRRHRKGNKGKRRRPGKGNKGKRKKTGKGKELNRIGT